VSEEALEKVRRRKRVLACPICKALRSDGSMVRDGERCKGGHIIINNARKVWQCQQCNRCLSINGSWVTTAKRHFNEKGVCVRLAKAASLQKALCPVEDDVKQVTDLAETLVPNKRTRTSMLESFSTGQLARPSSLPIVAIPEAASLPLASSFCEDAQRTGSSKPELETPFRPACGECDQPATVSCLDCDQRFCSSCDVKVHERSFAFLRRHQRKPLAQPEIPEILEVAKETVRHEAVMPFVEAPSPEAALQTFPPSGLCHQAMPVRCAKPNDVEDLFPNTPITEGVFKIELTVDDKTTSITEYSWTNTKVLQLVLPSYLSLAQHVHPPHTTTYYIKVSETALCRDPPLLFHYESKHCTMLDQANMLEGLTSIIQNIVQTQSDLLQQLNFSESANAASRIQKFSQFVVHYAAAKTPEVLEQLKTNLSGLAQWQAAARREGTLFAEAFLSSIAECVERHDASAPPSLSSCKEALPINAMILAIACMAQAGVTFIPLLWCLHLQMKAQAQPVHGSSAHLQPIDPQGVTA